MTLQEIQRRIAELTEQKDEAIRRRVEELLPDLTERTENRLYLQHYWDGHVEDLFKSVKKLRKPTGIKAFFFAQTYDEKQQLVQLMKELEERLVSIVKYKDLFPQDDELKAMRQQLRDLMAVPQPAPQTQPAYKANQPQYVREPAPVETSSSSQDFMSTIMMMELLNTNSNSPAVQHALDTGVAPWTYSNQIDSAPPAVDPTAQVVDAVPYSSHESLGSASFS